MFVCLCVCLLCCFVEWCVLVCSLCAGVVAGLLLCVLALFGLLCVWAVCAVGVDVLFCCLNWCSCLALEL